MKDSELRELCHKFFDAVECGDLGTVADLYAPGMKFWINMNPDKEATREENLATLEAGKSKARRRTYDDRRINTFAGGFVCQYTVNVVLLDGNKLSLWAALVVRCSNGQITRIDEYLDSSKFSSAQPKAA
jgi:ketosteroid isomerase-like protein